MSPRIERAPNGGEGIVPRPAWDVLDDASGALLARIRYSYGVYEARTADGALIGRPAISRDLVALADRVLLSFSEDSQSSEVSSDETSQSRPA